MQRSLIRKFFNLILLGFALFALYHSFNNNNLIAANNNWFKTFQLDSEQLVLDGLLYGGEIPKLGRFSRPSIENQHLEAHRLYEEANKEGIFDEYKSQYGLQIQIFNSLKKIGFLNVSHLKSSTALLMAIVVIGLTITIWRDFSGRSAFLFYCVFLLSPWIVSFSNNLYWISFSWFIPLLITSIFSPKACLNIKIYYLLLALIFVAFLFKFLSGYEYITTIVLASTVPIFYHGLKLNKSYKIIVTMCCGVFLVSFFAFALSVLIHAKSLDSSTISGLQVIQNTARKRLSADNLLIESCGTDRKCYEIYNNYSESLKSNPLQVTGQYFVNAKFLPWIESVSFDANEKKLIKMAIGDAKYNLSFYPFLDLKTPLLFKIILYLFETLISSLFFITLVVLCLRISRTAPIYFSIPLLVAFLSPLSWFIFAKGHSYVHTHMNYVLWYLYFIPFSVVILSEVKWKK